MRTRATLIFKDPNVVVSANNASNNMVFVCKSLYKLLNKGIKWQPYIF